ncbi:MAG TPA: hypothetical protein VN764_03610, partial [Polyangiaceae bacterium]|nr:hypothetical protein [Polyangiaceae bacterium]
ALLNELVYAELPGFMLQMDHPIFPLDITSGGNTFVGTGGTVIGAEANVAEAAGVGVFRSAAPRPARAAAPSLAEHAIASDAETQQMSPSIHVTVLKHAGSASGADSQKTVARLVNDQAPSNITLTAFPRPSFSTELNDNTAAGWLTRLYAAYCVLEEALRTGGVEAHMSGEIGAAYDALLGASQALGGLLEGYLAKHPPSLEEEGSFERHAYGSDILTRLQDKGCLCGFSALSKLVQENLAWLNRAASLFHFSSFLEHNAGIDHRGGVPMGGTFILVYDDQASGKLGGQLPGLVDRAVIADFYLPYRCCSTVPPVLFEIAPPPLPDPDPDPEPEPEVEPTLTIGGTADDLVLSELDPPRVVRVTPRGGELTVSGAAGFELTPREESAGASDFEEWNFDPAALTFPDGGAESQTIVIAYAVGAQTLSRSVTVVGSPRSEILSGSRIVRAAPGKPANLSLRGTVERATNPVWTVRDLGRRQAIGVTQSAAADGTLLATGSMALPAAIEVTLIAQQLGTGRVTTDTARLVEPSLLPELRGEAPETLGKMLLVIDDDLPDDPFEDVPGPSDGLASVRLQETLQSVEDEVKKQQELFGQGSKGSYAVHIVRGMTSLIKEPTFDKSRLPEALIYLSRLTLYVLRVGQKPLHMLEGQAIAALAKLSTRLDDLSTSQRAEWNMHIMVELESARLERVQRKELVDALSKLSEEIAPK